MNTQKRIAVIGAGIVGCSAALWLQTKGCEVTLIDPEDPGSGTSSGNACTIADYGCVPVNSPDLFKRLPTLISSTDSPLSLDLGYALGQPRWMFQFLRNCGRQNVERITRLLGELLARSYEGLDPLLDMTGARHLLRQEGCMYVYRDEQEFKAAAASNQARRQQGASFIELDAKDILDLEPHLKPGFKRGLLFENASHIANPLTLCQSYFDCFQRNQGKYLRATVEHANPAGDIVTLQLGNGEQSEFDRVIVAAGAFSKSVGGLGLDALPLDTERGYHVQYNGLQNLLKRPVSWNQAGFYATPMNEGLRFAGTVEIAGFSSNMNPRNLRYLVDKARLMFDLPEHTDQQWLGFRPTCPDALPVIGHSPVSDNILFAFGHQHLGLTLAGITGKLIAELVNGEQPSHNITPFSPRRFSPAAA